MFVNCLCVAACRHTSLSLTAERSGLVLTHYGSRVQSPADWRGLFPVLGPHKRCAPTHADTCVWMNMCVHFLDYLSGSGLLGDACTHAVFIDTAHQLPRVAQLTTLPPTHGRVPSAAHPSSLGRVACTPSLWLCAGVPLWFSTALP